MILNLALPVMPQNRPCDVRRAYSVNAVLNGLTLRVIEQKQSSYSVMVVVLIRARTLRVKT